MDQKHDWKEGNINEMNSQLVAKVAWDYQKTHHGEFLYNIYTDENTSRNVWKRYVGDNWIMNNKLN